MSEIIKKKIESGIGTAFQKRVWLGLLAIPRGTVWTYAQLAKEIGSPRAFRAVGTALGANPYAPEVPCHRVVRGDMRVGEYAFGIKRKISLLKREGISIKNGRVEK
ncbi:MAG: methylated-DNA--[protein]-cysteine S-methyltransferase [Candidatus Paceibacterota bacterium]